MAITGRFEADFSQYISETQRAVHELQAFESEADKTARLLGQVGAQGGSFAAITASTTVTRQQMESLALTAGRSTTAFGALAGGLGSVDKTLALMGVHIGPEVHALAEMSTMADGAAGALGTLSGAIGIAALAFGAFKVAQNIDWDSLDQHIADTTAKFLGMGDVVAETAGAKMDVLTKATDLLRTHTGDATREVKDFGEAQRIIAASMETADHRLSELQRGVRKLRADGDLPAIDEQLKNQTSTLDQLAWQYHTTVEVLQEYSREQAVAEQNTKKKTAADAAALEAERALAAVRTAAVNEIAAIADKLTGRDAVAEAEKLSKAIGDYGNIAGYAAEQQAHIAETTDKAITALLMQGDVTNPLIARFAELNVAATTVIHAQEEMARTAAATTAEEKRLNDEMARAYGASGGTDAAGFAAGLSGTGGSVLKPFQGLAPSVFAAGGVGAVHTPGTVVNNTFNVNGSADDVARATADRITRQVMTQRVATAR